MCRRSRAWHDVWAPELEKQGFPAASRDGITAVRNPSTRFRPLTIEHLRIVLPPTMPIDLASALPRLLPVAVEWAERQSASIRETGVALDLAGIQLARGVGVRYP